MVADLGIVEDALVRLDPVLVQDLRGELLVIIVFRNGFQRLLDRIDIVFRQIPRIGTRIRQDLVLLIQGLRQAERILRRKAEAGVGLALQAGQVE